MLKYLPILFYGFLTRITLKRKVRVTQWVALILCFIGMVLLEYSWRNPDSKSNEIDGLVIGMKICVALASAMVLSLSNIYIEKWLKQKPEGFSLWISVLQFNLGSFPFSIGIAVFSNNAYKIGSFKGFNFLVVVIPILYTMGAYLSITILVYSNNIIKILSNSACEAIVSVVTVLFSYNMGRFISTEFFIGTAFVGGSSLLAICSSMWPQDPQEWS